MLRARKSEEKRQICRDNFSPPKYILSGKKNRDDKDKKKQDRKKRR
jgi:hypothetical protein